MKYFNSNDLKGMKVLIADDVPANVDVLYKTLTAQGYEISIALNGENALAFAPIFLPDLILLDIMMPGIDGFETCQRLKSNEATQNIPVIFLTAKTGEEDIVKGFELGAIDYITKPFKQEEVLVRVRNQLMLRRYTRELERSNEDLESFASVVSHDLRAPLRKIETLGNFLKEDYEDLLDEKGKGFLNNMAAITSHLSKLINSLLEYSQVSMESKTFEAVDLNSIAKKTINNLDAQIQETNGKISIENLPTIEGEPYLLYQLFQNLIANALKFHLDGISPIIKISSEAKEKENWEIIIQDNGIGFDPKYAEKIFRPFERLVNRSEFEGCGIGLAHCKKIIDRHNGNILVESIPNQGSAFKITLPEKQPQQGVAL
jgi:two-component system, sensor histidine kinase and response regulator